MFCTFLDLSTFYLYSCAFLFILVFFVYSQVLLDYPKTSTELKSQGGVTPLIMCVKMANHSMLQQLIAKNVDIAATDNEGEGNNFNAKFIYTVYFIHFYKMNIILLTHSFFPPLSLSLSLRLPLSQAVQPYTGPP